MKRNKESMMKTEHNKLLIKLIAKIDDKLAVMTNNIIHHKKFQRLEASWRGLEFLVDKIPKQTSRLIQVRLLSLTERELHRDCCNATDVEHTCLFQKIYTEEYDRPGGIPFAIIIGDYSVNLTARGKDWVTVLSMMGQVAAATFSTLLMSVDANFFELNNYTELNENINLKRSFSQLSYQRWHKLRTREDMRFVHLLLPRVLIRKPYQQGSRYLANHGFKESITNLENYCWANPAYVMGAMIVSCYLRTGWFTDLRAEKINMPAVYQSVDYAKVFPSSRLEANISDKLEHELADHGFIGLTETAYVYSIGIRSCNSMHKAAVYRDDETSLNAYVATMLPYLLCASRFAHYLKILARDKVGTYSNAGQFEKKLQSWIYNYCGQANINNANQLARYPLRDAKIRVAQAPGQAGTYLCKMELQPNYYIEKINTKLRFISTIVAE